MYPEDRVLVGVINRKRDLEKARYEHWYRVPQGRVPRGIHAEYVAFFLSRAFGEMNGGIHYYARRTGLELARRRDLLPGEPDHPRANAVYHKLQFGELRCKEPPVLNDTRRSVAFILTTWDRFSTAETIADLYDKSSEFVDRVFYALERAGVRPEYRWESIPASAKRSALLRIECENGVISASTDTRYSDCLSLAASDEPGAVRASTDMILEAIRSCGGPRRKETGQKGE